MILGPAQNVAASQVQAKDSGGSSAMVDTVQQVGGSLGLGIFTTISASALDRFQATHTAAALTSASLYSYHVVFGVGAGALTLGVVLTAALLRPGRMERDGAADAG